MLFLSSVLVSTLILSTGVLSDIPDGEWTAPGVDIQLIESIDVSVYGEPLLNMLGRVSFVETTDGEKWRLVLVNTDNITILQEGAETRQIQYSFTADKCVMSPDNGYVVLVKKYDLDYRGAIRINTNTGEVKEFQPYADGCYLGTIVVSNSGSVITSHDQGISFFDSDLNFETCLEEYSRKGNNWINRNNDGSLVFITDELGVIAYDEAGNVQWHQDGVQLSDGSHSYQRIVFSEESDRLVLTGRHSTVCLNSTTGEIQWVKDGESHIWTSKSIFSPSGNFLYLGSFPIGDSNQAEWRAFVDVISENSSWRSSSSTIYVYPSGRQRFILPFSASDNGMFLCKVSGGGTTRFLLDSDCHLLWAERVSSGESSVSGAPYGGPGCLSRDGQRMCLFSNEQLKVFTIGEI